jgi:uncharacterized protein (DUF58 family)
MDWIKNIKTGKTFEAVILISVLLLLISLYHQNYLMMFLGGLLLALTSMSYYYLVHVSDFLVLVNERETIRLSVGDETTLLLKLSQFSRLPIFQANLLIKLEAIVEGIGIPTVLTEPNVEFNIPIQLNAKETIQIPLQLKALKRGTTKIKSIEIKIENFFGFGSVDLKYSPFIQREIIIHPNSISVPGSEALISTNSYGDFTTPTSMFEHILAPIGTRDYVPTDSFHRINWKASAKTQKLQTKVFEKTSHFSWSFIINLRVPYTSQHQLGVVENLESIISNVAYLAQIATKKGIQFEVFINLRMASHSAVYHLPIGGEIQQLGKMLDTLARINSKGNTLPNSKLLHYVDKQQQHSPVVIACGPYDEEGYRFFNQLQKKGQKVYILHDDSKYPIIVPFGRRSEAVGNR